MRQWPYRVLDVVTDTYESNELVMLCVHDAHEALLKIPPTEWPPLDDHPSWLMFEKEQRFARLMDRLTKNVPPIESMRIGAMNDVDTTAKVSTAMEAHIKVGATLAHLVLFGDGPEPTAEVVAEFSRVIAEMDSLTTVQLCRFTFRGSKKQVLRTTKAAGLAMMLTLALLHSGKRVELYHCAFVDKAGGELSGEMRQHFAPGSLSLGSCGAQLIMDDFSRATLSTKDATYFAEHGNVY
jgi:hypothetical protein